MTIDEIFLRLSEHMLNGVMAHESFATYYDFLGLKGYKQCHEYHFLKELSNYRTVCKYYTNHYSKIIPKYTFSNPEIIPDAWYNHTREEVSANDLQNAVRDGLTKWAKWERDTKHFYEEMYSEALNIKEIATANLIMCLIEDVDCELKKVERYVLEKKATNYNLSDIIYEQKAKHDKYKKKRSHIFYE